MVFYSTLRAPRRLPLDGLKFVQASLSLVNSLLPQTNIWRHFFENNPEKKYEQYFNYSVEKIFLKKTKNQYEEETAITHPTLQKYKVPQVYFMIFASNENTLVILDHNYYQ